MAAMATTCDIPEEVVAEFRKMKMSKSKTNNALVLTINTKELRVEVGETLNNFTWEALQEELPDSTPRFLAISYCWNMGEDRVSYPLVFIYYAPREFWCWPVWVLPSSFLFAFARVFHQDQHAVCIHQDQPGQGAGA